MAMFTDFLKQNRKTKKKQKLTDLGDQVAFSGSDPVVFEVETPPPSSSTPLLKTTFT